MKAFLPVVYILTVAILACNADSDHVQQFYAGIEKCADEMGLPHYPIPPVLECMLRRVNLIDQHTGGIRKVELLNYLENIISHPIDLLQARERVTICFDHENQPGRPGLVNTREIIRCSGPMLKFIDKLP